jgi:multiple sugar transport system substrate-binding protein
MFLTSDSSVDAYTKTIGFLPSVQSALVSWAKDSVYKALVECLKYGKAYTSIPQWGEAENILVALFSDIWAVLEFEDLYSEQRIYGILSKYHAEMNKLLQHENQEISFEEFQKIWNSVIVLRETEKQETEKTESQNGFFKNFSVGLFVMMMIFGFAFTYRRKR